MFTGVIECTGKIVALERDRSNLILTVDSPIGADLREGQSVNHNGVCLTVTSVEGSQHTVTAIRETLEKSNLGLLHMGEEINLERAMPAQGRFEGHIVQGHVDARLECVLREDRDGSVRFSFPLRSPLIAHKGSVCLNGVSLTVSSIVNSSFTVDVIPITLARTTMSSLKPGDSVNVEYDIIGRYLQQMTPQGLLICP